MKLVIFLGFVILIAWSFGSFAKSDPCRECADLARIEKRAKRDMLKPDFAIAPHSVDAAKMIVAMSKKSKTLDETRIASVVSIFRVLVPKDPVDSILNLTRDVISDNRDAIDAKLATLPEAEMKFLTEAIDDAFKMAASIDEEEVTEATPPPAGPFATPKP